PWSKPAGNNSGADRAHCSMKLRTRSASSQMSSYCCWVIGMTICLAPRGTCVEGVFRSRSTCRVLGRASILASASLERSRMTKMPPAGYPAFLQYLQSGRVSKIDKEFFAKAKAEGREHASSGQQQRPTHDSGHSGPRSQHLLRLDTIPQVEFAIATW